MNNEEERMVDIRRIIAKGKYRFSLIDQSDFVN